ncbi:MAG: YgjV family protein [Bacilli bacterium]|nr:YgjV family protein [Bacilli bacterium]
MNIAAEVLGVFGTISNITAFKSKKKSQILIALFLTNIIFGISLFILKSYSGSIISFILSVQTIISYQYEDKTPPYILIIIFIVLPLIVSIIFYNSYIDIVPIVCSLIYTLSIMQNKRVNILKTMLLYIICWAIYNFSVGFYSAFVNNIIILIFNINEIIKLKDN